MKFTVSNSTGKHSGGKIWGIFFVLAAFFLIFDAVGGSFGVMGLDEVPLFRLLLAATLTLWALIKLFSGNFSLTFFPLAFAFMLIEDWIAKLCGLESANIVNNWLLLLCALLLTTGCGILTSDWKLLRIHKHSGVSKTASIEESEHQSSETYSFGDYTKYIDSATFKKATITSSFAETNVYFENVDAYVGGGTLYVTNAFGEVNIHVPSTWNISAYRSSNAFGNISVPHRAHIEDAPTLTVCAANSFGEICIK